jgi:ribonuclease HII
MRCTRRLENLAYAAGRRCVAGVDEVGRGALFGPVVAAAVVLGSSCRIAGINDSKRLLPEARAALDEKIRAGAVAWSVAVVDAARIDRINIYQASRQAMRDAVVGLDPRPDLVLVDAMRLDLPWEVEQRAIIHGDARCVSIAAASILAKVHRDRLMEDWDRVFPQYHLARNKGYGTAAHLRSLDQFGVTPEHRRSYRPVAARSLFPMRTEERHEPLPLFPE